ncbi:MAG: hypothetical protein APR55_11795 [Methanolinea sp. SDB]|nr:MAG: hypothetical protein APR55_11795 [Methanolinea sp. SDB]
MKRVIRNEDAFTGLEAAIVLIAFVVVAAVFSYVVLGAGFFTTQKSQEVVHSGVTQAASNIVVKGEVYGIANTGMTAVERIRFDVGLAAGGLPVDIQQAAFTLSTENEVQSLTFNTTTGTQPGDGNWTIGERHPTTETDNILQAEESMTIYVDSGSIALSPRTMFNLEIKPEIGASLGVQRTIPPSITNVTLLY